MRGACGRQCAGEQSAGRGRARDFLSRAAAGGRSRYRARCGCRRRCADRNAFGRRARATGQRIETDAQHHAAARRSDPGRRHFRAAPAPISRSRAALRSSPCSAASQPISEAGSAASRGARWPRRRPAAAAPRGGERDAASSRLASFGLPAPARVRIVPGPQRDFFTDAEFEAFTNSDLYRRRQFQPHGLASRPGDRSRHRRGANIVSDAVAPGSIQIPGDGQPIVLLADRQTTGGYPKIANVISADIPALGRLKAGATRSDFGR